MGGNEAGGVKVRIGVIVSVIVFVFSLITAAVGWNYCADANQDTHIEDLSKNKSDKDECRRQIARTENMIAKSEGRIIEYMKERFDQQNDRFKAIEKKLP